MIIGFAGKAASGKTTAARQMAPLLSGEAHIIPMAKVLRDEVEQFLQSIGSDQYIPLVYGCQEDKIKTFYVDREKARDACPKWDHFIKEHQDIQDLDKLTAVTVRRILQWWGTEYRREQDPDYWTKAWTEKVTHLDLANSHVLIDDVRFMNELNAIKELGGLIIKIERPGFNGAGNHASETSLDDYTGWDATICNDASLEVFLGKIDNLTEEISTNN